MNFLSAAQNHLTESSRQLSSAWGVTKEVWHDSARQDFETNIWSEFETVTATSLEKLQALAETIAQAEREMP